MKQISRDLNFKMVSHYHFDTRLMYSKIFDYNWKVCVWTSHICSSEASPYMQPFSNPPKIKRNQIAEWKSVNQFEVKCLRIVKDRFPMNMSIYWINRQSCMYNSLLLFLLSYLKSETKSPLKPYLNLSTENLFLVDLFFNFWSASKFFHVRDLFDGRPRASQCGHLCKFCKLKRKNSIFLDYCLCSGPSLSLAASVRTYTKSRPTRNSYTFLTA